MKIQADGQIASLSPGHRQARRIDGPSGFSCPAPASPGPFFMVPFHQLSAVAFILAGVRIAVTERYRYRASVSMMQ
jgi:hypothetical protein